MTATVPIVTTDYGGSGPDVLLLHGAGRTRRDWAAFAPLLRERGYHPVAMDLRGHGDSGAGPWSWPSVLADVGSVVKGLTEAVGNRPGPVVIGHSLGGLVAALWAGQHPECPLAVNIDGHGNPTRPDQYFGLDEMAAARAYVDMTAFLTQAAEGLTGPLVQVMREVDALDLIGIYRVARCPLLVVTGTTDPTRWLPEHLVPPWEAYQAWMTQQLATLERDLPNFTTATLPDGYEVHIQDPEGLLRIVLAHLGTSKAPDTSKQA